MKTIRDILVFFHLIVLMFCSILSAHASASPDDDLWYAVRIDDAAVAETALQNGSNLAIEDDDGITPFYLAVEMGHADVVRVLLEHGADVNAFPVGEDNIFDEPEMTPLMLAADSGHFHVAKTLLEHDANPNIQRPSDGKTACMLAISEGFSYSSKYFYIAKLLVKHGADISIQDKNGESVSSLVMEYDDSHSIPQLQWLYELMPQRSRPTISSEEENEVDQADLLEMLLDAYYDENPEKIEQLLQRGVDVNIKDDEGLTPLMQVASFGEYEIAQILIRYGADVNMTSDEFIPKGWTPLMFAIDQKFGDIARLLLQHGADVNKPATNGETPLILAVQNGNLDIIRLLLQYDVNVNAQDEDGETALFFAAYGEMFDVVNRLYEYGADIHIKNHQGETILIKTLQAEMLMKMKSHWIEPKHDYYFYANQRERIEPEFTKIVEWLLAHDIDVNARGPETEPTALMLAAAYGENNIITQLLERGAEVNSEVEQKTAFSQAIRYRQKESAKLLLQSGATIQAIDEKDITPVVNAIFNEQQTIFSQYLKNGIDVHIKLQDESSLLLYAVIAGNIAAVEALIEHGADISLIDRDGKNALLTAIDVGDIAMIKTLLQKGADVNGKIETIQYANPKIYGTSLAYATASGQKEIVQLLLDSGAAAKIKTEDGATAMKFAYLYNHYEIMDILEDAGAERIPEPL